MKDIDKMLQDALLPSETMSEELKGRVLSRVAGGKEHTMTNIREYQGKRRVSVAAAIAVVLLAASSVTALAAWKYLSASDVAQRVDDERLAAAFLEGDVWNGSETQSCGGYEIFLLGVVSGEELSDFPVTYNGELVSDSTYAVVAIRRADGTPMPDTSDESYGETDFLVSPYIEGYSPARYNIFTLKAGGYEAVVENGVQYRIMSVENIEAFADRTIYLGVSEGTFYNPDAYVFDEQSGAMMRNEAYAGVNALFTLPIDSSKADSKKAAEIIAEIENPSEENESEDPYLWATEDVKEFMSRLTADNIDVYATPIASTIQTVKPDADGYYHYSYELPGGAKGSGTQNVYDTFPDGKAGMSENFGWSTSEGGLEDLLIETHTLNEDGTVTYAIYIPRQ